jgi:hypothetical protein
LGRAFLRQGDAAAAAKELELAATLGGVASRRALFWYRLEALVKSDRGADARRVLDDAVNDPGRDTTSLHAYTVAGLNELLGRNRPPPVDSARMRRMDSIYVRQNRARLDSIARSVRSNPAARRGFSGLIADGDTLEARRQLAQLDSMLAQMSGGWLPRVTSMHLGSANNHLALRDTAGAEARLAEIEQAFNYREFRFSITNGGGPWVGNAWMLSGDLAAARRRFAEAARMYRRVIGLWGGGDPDLQPLVDKARARLESLPP